MALLTVSVPSFVGGASQQDDSVRNPTQLTDAINAWLHPAMGHGKRPPAEHVGILAGDISHMDHFHSIVRDSTERYIVAVGNGTIRVFDHITGHEYNVVPTGAALDYLQTAAQPWSVFRTATVADTTFVVNTERVVKMSTELSPGHLTGTVQTFDELPKSENGVTVPPNVIYEVAGAEGNEFDNFYVQRSGEGVWLEVARPRIPHRLDSATMPHVLKRIPDPIHADGFWFSFGPPEWGPRLAGDETTAFPPSFVDDRVADVFYHRERLGFLSTENCAMSEAGHPFNFWKTTTTQLLDSDPVDFSVVTDGVTTLRHAISYESALLLFGDRMNFQMTAEPFLTPKTPKVDPLVNYECSRWVSPEMLGDSLYFVADSGAFASLREYFVDDISVTGDAADVTAHVPRYVPGRIRAVAGAPNADVIFVAPEAAPSQLYAYFVRWSGNEKAQSAWCRWNISGVGRVVHMRYIDDKLYVLAQAPGGGVEMLRVSLSLAAGDGDFTEDYSFLLDRLKVVLPVHHEFGNYTDITVPYVLDSLDDVTVAMTDDWETPGALVDLRGASLVNGGQTIRLDGNHAEGRVVVGLNYEHRATLTRPYLRDQRNNSTLVGRLQVRDITVAYKDGAYFEVEVHTRGREADPQRYVAGHNGLFTSRVLGDSTFTLGSPRFHSGERRFPVHGRADQTRVELVNRLPYQCWFLSAQYRALFNSRSQV